MRLYMWPRMCLWQHVTKSSKSIFGSWQSLLEFALQHSDELLKRQSYSSSVSSQKPSQVSHYITWISRGFSSILKSRKLATMLIKMFKNCYNKTISGYSTGKLHSWNSNYHSLCQESVSDGMPVHFQKEIRKKKKRYTGHTPFCPSSIQIGFFCFT